MCISRDNVTKWRHSVRVCTNYFRQMSSFTHESVMHHIMFTMALNRLFHEVSKITVSPCVAVCCSVLQCIAVYCSVLQCVAVCCSALQCVAVCCSVTMSNSHILYERLYHTYERVMPHIWIRHATWINASCQTHELVRSHMNESDIILRGDYN